MMGDYISFWIGKVLADAIVAAVLFGTALAVLVVIAVATAIRESRCKHLRYREAMNCDAICADCGKNLGFIGTLRKNRGGLQ